MQLISIVLPTYNGNKRIATAVNSVVAQTFKDWELLVIDDGSTDNTAGVVCQYCQEDNRIKYFKNDINLGIQKTLNKGLDMAQGKYIARIDDDDEWIDNEKLQKQIDFLKSNPNYILIGTNAIFVDELGKELVRICQPKEDAHIRKQILKKNCFIHSSVMFVKDVVMECGGYSELSEKKHIEDYDLWLKLGLRGKMYNLQSDAIKYLVCNHSVSAKNQREQYLKEIRLIKPYKSKYPGYFIAYLYQLLKLFLFGFLGFLPVFSRENQFRYKKILQQKINH